MRVDGDAGGIADGIAEAFLGIVISRMRSHQKVAINGDWIKRNSIALLSDHQS